MIYTDGAYLVADSSRELHIFAQKIGLKREWYKERVMIPHYFIYGAVIKRALKAGAKRVSTTEIMSHK